MDIFLAILAIILLIVGLIGSFLPVLPGPILGYIGLLLIHLTSKFSFSTEFLIIRAIVIIAITALDYVIPVWGTKKFGGSKRGTTGSTIGLIISVIILPILGITIGPFGLVGLILGPFLGALIGEMLHGKTNPRRSAMGSFIGFLTNTFLKFAVTAIAGYYIVRAMIFMF